jgi:peptidoglycan/xylan/chitin deacetylase (PgdA/CDA1 family)
MERISEWTRRRFLAMTAAGIVGAASDLKAAERHKALIAITLDLEMSRNFPTREDTHWDYEKGNLNAETKAYTVEACRRVKAEGGVVHCFVVGRVLEQEDVTWLKGIVNSGHAVGNHTYDHVNVLATRHADVQFRFQRAPWLAEGRTPEDMIRDNFRLATAAMKTRLDIEPNGFRTPGDFADGLRTRPDVRAMLRGQGFSWVSSLYPSRETPRPNEKPVGAIYDSIVRAQAAAQPFIYTDGLVEIPMSPISDIGAFRTGRWRLDWFLKAVRLGVEWAIEHRAVYDFLAHPSCLDVTDPDFHTIDLICDLVRKGGDKVAIVSLDTLARRAIVPSPFPSNR